MQLPLIISPNALTKAQCWRVVIAGTCRVHIHDMRIHADQHPSCGAPGEEVRAVNSDGIDVDSSQDVLIERTYIEADDDAVR